MITEIFSKYCDLISYDNINDLDIFSDLDLDSMAMMNLLLEIEEFYGVQFSPFDYEDRRIRSLSGIMELVNEYKAQTG